MGVLFTNMVIGVGFGIGGGGFWWGVTEVYSR